MDAWLSAFVAAEGLPPAFAHTVRAVCDPLADRIALASAARGRPPGFVVGLCGTQASGKSTLVAVLRRTLEDRGLRVASFSLDDLYLTRAERAALARRVHPLFAVRGAPGTHDTGLGERVLEALGRSGEVALPSFDKGADDRRPEGAWPRVQAPVEVILFEGWCVGARPEDPEALAAPVNALERDEDPRGLWRAHANEALAGPYQRLFERVDMLVLLQAPSFEVVLAWRQEQEAKLRARLAAAGEGRGRAMTDAQVVRFIAHYERLTRHILAEMPGRAEVVVRLDAERRGVVG